MHNLSERCLLALAALLALNAGDVRGENLALSAKIISGPESDKYKPLADNDIGTVWVGTGDELRDVLTLTFDLQQPHLVHRLWLTPGSVGLQFTGAVKTVPSKAAKRKVNVFVGETPDTKNLVGSALFGPEDSPRAPAAGEPAPNASRPLQFAFEAEFTFRPALGRYVRVELCGGKAPYQWRIAELEICGVGRPPPEEQWGAIELDLKPGDDAVLAAASAGELRSLASKGPLSPLAIAARELRYYLIELAGQPCAIVPSGKGEKHSGPRFRLVSPPDEKLPAPEMDPDYLEDVRVEKDGAAVAFRGPTPRAVLYGVYEFLYRQGIRWVYPGPHGDYVPPRKDLDLACLPIAYRPSFPTRYGNYNIFDIESVRTDDCYLWHIRNHVNGTWGQHLRHFLGGVVPRHRLGFGYAHTLQGEVIPWAVIKQHPEWQARLEKADGAPVPCTRNPAVVDFVVNRVREEHRKNPALQGFGLHPKDSERFCECEKCRRAIEPLEMETLGAFWPNTPNCSDLWFAFIAEVAGNVKADLGANKFISTLAYYEHNQPPRNMERLPDNVFVDVCQYGARNLPMDSSYNTEMKRRLTLWAKKCAHLGIWDYTLLHCDGPHWPWPVIAPMVSGMADRYRLLKHLGYRHVGTQASDSMREDPFNFYAWARLSWNPEQDPKEILRDFFKGYYREAWEPMLAWYTTLEDHMLARNIPVHDPRLLAGWFYGTEPRLEAFTPEITAAMNGHLKAAEERAMAWYVKERIAYARACLEWNTRQAPRFTIAGPNPLVAK